MITNYAQHMINPLFHQKLIIQPFKCIKQKTPFGYYAQVLLEW